MTPTTSPALATIWDCAPSLDDEGILEFIRNGYLILPGVVNDDTNRRVLAYLEKDHSTEPSPILREAFFHQQVILNPQVTGAVRSLLGADFGLPVLMSNHHRRGPAPSSFGWHVDGGSHWRPQITDLQVFYYPQETPESLAPTHLLPGSHLVPNTARAMGHLGSLRGERSTASVAGSIFITMYRIWHRASPATSPGVRQLLKYCYFRRTAPKRDWRTTPGFDPSRANFSGPSATLGEQFHDSISAAEMYTWLCGQHEHFRHDGGQSWPLPAARIDTPYGFPQALSRTSPASPLHSEKVPEVERKDR
jgi:hypothetical protein